MTTDRIRSATATDEELQRVISAISTGWSERNQETQCYWNIRDELTCDDGIIYKASATVIPKALRPEFLRKTHAAHLGFDSMCRRAKDALFWPGMRNDLKNVAATCEACQTYRPAQQREPLIGKPIPVRPWQVIHQDIFVWQDCHYLVTVDGFSDYFELDRLGRETTSANLIKKTKVLLARYGRPEEFYTDSDPRYLAEEFQKFFRIWQVTHKVSSPHHHQSNGKSESAVKAAKRLVKKCKLAGQCLDVTGMETDPPG